VPGEDGECHHQGDEQHEDDEEAKPRAAAFSLALFSGSPLRPLEPVRALQRLGVGDGRLRLGVPGRLGHRPQSNEATARP